MKKSKRLLALVLSVLMLMTTVISTTVISASAEGTLSSYYKTNPNGQVGANKTISIDGSISDWDSSMLIAQGTANDDPRVYRPNSMYEVAIDLYALYGAYDDNNLYLMWEMTNVQDVVSPSDDYPLSQGTLWQTQELPFFIAVDTGKSDTAIGNNGALITGGTIWNSGMTFGNSFNKLISINTKGGNGPWVYGGDSTGLNPVEQLDASTSKVDMGYGSGILSQNVYGIDKAHGHYNNRVPGDVCNESSAWVDFNTIGHNSSKYDFFYELSIPYSELGITKDDVASNGIGVMVVATMGMSAMDCLPGDPCMTDQADLDDAANSQENNSFEKSDEDFITASFARIGKLGSNDSTIIPTTPTTPVVTDPVVIPTTTEAPATIPTTEGTEPIVIPPVVTDPSETTETPDIEIPTLDTGDDTTDPTETTKETDAITDATEPSNVTPATGLLGDADNNGKVNIKDATLIQKHLAKIENLDDNAQFLSNVDANEILNIRDVTYIQKWIAKMPVEYAIGEPVSSGEIVIPTVVEPETTDAIIVVPTVVEPTEAPATTEPTEATTEAPVTEPTEITTEMPVVTDPITEPTTNYTEPTPDYGTITLYFENSYGWSNVCWHAWNEAGAASTAWPGDAMTHVEGNVYSATISSEYTGIIFNDGTMEGAKTDNLTVGADGQIFRGGSWTTYNPYDNPVGGGNTVYFSNNKGWTTVYAYCWTGDNKNAEWPGVPMTLIGQNGYSEDVYSYDVPDGMSNIVFTDGTAQTVDIDLNSVTDNGFYLTDPIDGKFGYGTYPYTG